MSTSGPTYWKCQCGVDVPIGCSHYCGPYPLREGPGVAIGHPRMDVQIATLQAENRGLRKVADAARHRGQCHGSLCACDVAIRAALDELDCPCHSSTTGYDLGCPYHGAKRRADKEQT